MRRRPGATLGELGQPSRKRTQAKRDAAQAAATTPPYRRNASEGQLVYPPPYRGRWFLDGRNASRLDYRQLAVLRAEKVDIYGRCPTRGSESFVAIHAKYARPVFGGSVGFLRVN